MEYLRFLLCVFRGVRSGKDLITSILDCWDSLPPIEDPDPSPPVEPPQPGTKEQALASRVRLTQSGRGCTGTLLPVSDSETGRYVLTAAHCVDRAGSAGSGRTTAGETFNWSVVSKDGRADLALLQTSSPLSSMPGVATAAINAPSGTPIWHAGYGVDQPGNEETGTVTTSSDGDGQCEMRLSASSGDSGGGIFSQSTNQIVSVVCCGAGRRLWGGNVASIRRLLGLAQCCDGKPETSKPYVE